MKGTVKIGAAEAYSQQMRDNGWPVYPAGYEGLKSLEGQEIEVTDPKNGFYIYAPTRLALMVEDFENPPQ
jgi:hypothetical protein